MQANILYRVLTDDENGDLKGEKGLVVWAMVGSSSSSPTKTLSKSTESKCRVPPLSTADCLPYVVKHGEEEDHGEDDSCSETWIVAIGGCDGTGVIGDASFRSLRVGECRGKG